jgi:putative ABC transport system permease protein
MTGISLRSVRHWWALFAGAFITLCLGTALVGVTAAGMAATFRVPATSGGPVVTVADGSGVRHTIALNDPDMGGIQSILALAGVVSGFITIVVVAGTFAFSVALRRRDMALLRLVGADGGQVRRMVLGESVAVAVPAGLAGCVLAAASTPVALEALNHTNLTPVPLQAGSLHVPLGIALAGGLLIAVLGAMAASWRAGRVRPAEAMREADIDAKVMTASRWIIGLLLLGGGVAMTAVAPAAGAEAAAPLAIFGPMALAVAATALGPVYLPMLVTPLAGLARFGLVSGGLATATIRRSRRQTASLVAPVLAVVAIVGSLTSVLATTATAATADQIAHTRGQLVVRSTTGEGLDRPTLARLRQTGQVAAVSAPAPFPLVVVDERDASLEDAVAVDLPTLAATSRLRAVEGRLGALPEDGVAMSKEYAGFDDYHVGDRVMLALFDQRRVMARVQAVVDGGANGPELMISPSLAGPSAGRPQQAVVLLAPGASPAAVARRLTGELGAATVQVMPTGQWFAASTSAQNGLNRLVLVVLSAPASVYALIAIANTLIMSFTRRRREFAGMRLLGVSRSQIQRTVLWEAATVVVLGTVLAAAMIGLGLTVYRTALLQVYTAVPLSVPWAALAGLAGACLVVATITAVATVNRLLRRQTATPAWTDTTTSAAGSVAL